MIPPLVAAGHRVVAPDLVGFGRSDKPTEQADYSYARHIEWTSSLVFDHLALDDITCFGQDWGGLIGLRLVAAQPDRFARVVIGNTGLKNANAVAVLNEVFTARGIDLPLPDQGTTTEEDRFEAGRAIQIPIYGDEIAESVAGLPDPFREAVPRFLTAFGFGDFYTRDGLDVPTRELLILCLLAALGQAAQIKAHIIGNLRLGNSKETQVAALVHCFPYIGFPLALNAIRVIQEVPDQPTT